MAGIWNIRLLWSSVLVLLTYAYMCSGCTPTTPPEVVDKIHHSDIFLHGRVIENYTGGYDYDTLYTVQVEVFCIFKGPILNRFINITYAGQRHEPGLCTSNHFQNNKDYLIFLDEFGNNEVRPSFNEEIYDSNLGDDIFLYCEVDYINYPKGVTEETSEVECPAAYPDYEECIAYVPPTSTSAPTTVTTQSDGDVVVKTLAPDDSSSDENDGDKETAGQTRGSSCHVLASIGVTLACLLVSWFF